MHIWNTKRQVNRNRLRSQHYLQGVGSTPVDAGYRMRSVVN